MKISSSLFEAFLKCPTKCWLRANDETSSGNDYAEWLKANNASFRTTQTQRLLSETTKEEYATALLELDEAEKELGESNGQL